MCPRAGHLHRTPFNASFSPCVPPSVPTKSALPISNAPHVGPLPYNSATATQLAPSRSSPPSSWLLQLPLKNADLLACQTQLEILEQPSRAQHQPITSCSLPSLQAHFLPVLATLNSSAFLNMKVFQVSEPLHCFLHRMPFSSPPTFVHR